MKANPNLTDAIETVADITARAEAMHIGLAAYPVEDILALLAAARRSQMRAVAPVLHPTQQSEAGTC